MDNDSVKNTDRNPKFRTAKINEKIAGQNHQFPVLLSTPQTENAAPVTGPIMKPIAKATPTKAYGIGKCTLTIRVLNLF